MRIVILGLIAAAVMCPTAGWAACAGDCNGDAQVAIDELVRSVDVALGAIALEECTAADLGDDGIVSVDELVAAVKAALDGCVPGTSTPTLMPTITPTPLPGCGDGRADEDEECDDGNRAGGDGCSADCDLEPGGNPCAGVAPVPGTALTAVRIAAGLDQPLHVTAPRLDPHRVFVVEQPGRIRILVDGGVLPTAFLDIASRVSCCTERGLLGLAFHPDFERNGRFFVDYTNRSGDTVISRFEVGNDRNRVDPATERILLTIDQPFANHNGGQVAFGPDGYLYVGMGDGGFGGDPNEVAQDDASLLGKLLRLDVDVDEAPYYAVPPSNPRADRGMPLGLIWAKGLRNPWRFSFDRLLGDLYIGDVGQQRFEEIDVQPAASTGGENYGWDVFEGDACYDPPPLPECPNPADGFTAPVLTYGRTDGFSVTGGFVYRGCALPDLRGTYFYGDYGTAFIRSFVLAEGRASAQHDWTAEVAPGGGLSIREISSFGEDARGELYVVDLGGEVFKLVPVP